MRYQKAWAPVLGFLAVLGAACSSDAPRQEGAEATPASLLPMSLHGMPIVSVTVGEDAEALIRRLHAEDVAPVSSYVGHYEGGGASATLYVSRFANAAQADSVVARMARAIGVASGAFAHHTRFAVDDVQVHAALGEGHVHFFYAGGPAVAWLETDPRMARVGLAEMLGVAPDRIPDGVVLAGVQILPPPDSLYRQGFARSTPATATSERPGGPR